MNFLHIKETCLYVTDLERTQSFYHDKLGLEIIGKVEGRHIFFNAGTSVLLCFIADKTENNSLKLPSHGATGHIHFAFEVNPKEYESIKQEILQKSIVIEHEQEWKNKLHSFYFRDPDGHLLEVAQKGIWDV